METQTVRFGTINVGPEMVIHFRNGLPGFSRLRKFCLVESVTDPLFLWLQSLEDGRIAFPVIEPQICMPTYKLPVGPEDLLQIGVETTEQIKVFCIVTIPENPKEMSANLRAPILISLRTNLATQVISSDGTYPVKHPIFNDLQRFVSVATSDDTLPETGKEFQIHRLRESEA